MVLPKPLHACGGRKVDVRLHGKGNSKLPWRKAGRPRHLVDVVDSDQQVVNKELSLSLHACSGAVAEARFQRLGLVPELLHVLCGVLVREKVVHLLRVVAVIVLPCENESRGYLHCLDLAQ